MARQLLAERIEADGSPRQTLKFHPQRDLIAVGIEFHCTKSGAFVHQITFAAKPVWYSAEGIEVENFTKSPKLQEKIRGASIRGGLTIFIEVSLPSGSALTVLLAMRDA